MGVYIKGFRKPTYCIECPLIFDYDCMMQHEQRDNLIDQYKHCPLIEVTEPHGRLVDESEIHTGIRMEKNTEYRYFIDKVNAPTVIESEGE